MTNAAGAVQGRAEGAVLSVSTADEDERLRGLIRAELDRRYALPVARRTLELMAEAAAEPAPGSPGYRIVDRNGETRLRPVEAEPQDKAGKAKARKPRKGDVPEPEPEASRVPMTLSELVEELRAHHPALFGTPPPEPEPPQPLPEHHSGVGESVGETVAHVRAASAKFVETQAALAKSLAASSAERGRALASAAGETVGGWRQQIDERLKTHRAATPESGAPPGPEALAAALPLAGPGAPQPAASAAPATLSGQASATQPRRGWRAFGRGVAVGVRAGGERVRARLRRNPKPDAVPAGAPATASVPVPAPIAVPTMREVTDDLLRRRLITAGLGGATVIAVVFATVLLVRQVADGQPPDNTPPERPSQQAEAAPPQASPPAAQDAAPSSQAAPAVPPGDPELQPDEQPQRRNANDVVGVPEVIDTATLRISGKLVHLFGVEWVRGGQADELSKYLAGRSVTCQPAPGSSAYLCSVNGRDISEVVLFNGGGRASSEATPDLVAAEDRARSERLGVWKR